MSVVTSDAVVATPSSQRAPRARRAQVLRVTKELLIIAVLCFAYREGRMLTKDHIPQAMRNAWRVVDVERRFGVYTEGGLQRLVLHSRAVVEFLNHYYVGVHFPLTALFVVWVVIRHADVYHRIRTWFIWVTAVGLLIHVLFPLAPPRLLPGQGIIDTLRLYGPNIYKADLRKSVTNQIAAMPSLHFGWALLVAFGFHYIKAKRWAWIAFIHPFLMLMAIVATGNHYWLDAGIAMLIVGAVLGLTEGRRYRRRKLEAARGDASPEADESAEPAVVAATPVAAPFATVRARVRHVAARPRAPDVWCSPILVMRPMRI